MTQWVEFALFDTPLGDFQLATRDAIPKALNGAETERLIWIRPMTGGIRVKPKEMLNEKFFEKIAAIADR